MSLIRYLYQTRIKSHPLLTLIEVRLNDFHVTSRLVIKTAIGIAIRILIVIIIFTVIKYLR